MTATDERLIAWCQANPKKANCAATVLTVGPWMLIGTALFMMGYP